MAQGRTSRVSASIVTYGGFEESLVAAQSLLTETRGVGLTLYVVDNASPDGTGKKMAQALAGQPGAAVLQLGQNLGFGGGHNQVLPHLQSTYHAVVNPDIRLETDALTAMADYLDTHPDVAAVVPRLLFPDGKEQHVAKRLPSFLALMGRHIPFPGAKKLNRHYLMLDEDLSQPRDIQFCTGCFFMMRTEVFKAIGGFDNRYFMYFEDVDIGREAQAHGRLVYLPQVSVYHAWHRKTNSDAGHFLMQLRSMFVYFKKWGFKLV